MVGITDEYLLRTSCRVTLTGPITVTEWGAQAPWSEGIVRFVRDECVERFMSMTPGFKKEDFTIYRYASEQIRTIVLRGVLGYTDATYCTGGRVLVSRVYPDD